MNETFKGKALMALRIVYFGMVGGTIFFSGIFYFVAQSEEPALAEFRKNIFVIMLFVAALVLSISSFMWNKDIRSIQQGALSLEGKFNAYRAALIKRYALVEFAVLLSAILYFLTKEQKLYIVIGILVVYFVTLYPSSSKISEQVGENAEDIEKL